MRIAHVSDFHFTRLTWNPLRLFSKRILAHLNWLLVRKKHFSEKQIEPLPSLFNELGVDLVLLGGDFSTTALPQEFERAAQFVQTISQPWIAIPGNHDHYTYRSYRNKHFYRYFKNVRKTINHSVELFNLKDHGVEAHEIGPHWWVVCLDTALATHPYSSEGLFSQKIETHLKEVIQLIPQTDSILLFNHFPFFQNDTQRHNLKRGEELKQFIEKEPRIRLYLHGHTHRHTVADLQVNHLPIVLDSGSCAQGRKGAWNLIDLTTDGCSVSTYRWNHKWTQTRKEEFRWTRATFPQK